MRADPYSQEELEVVYSIYKRVQKSIHKSNPLIIEIAGSLGRDTRSVENQLLMFRAYERELNGAKYGRKNYNKLVPVVYDKHNTSVNMVFPDRFRKFRKSEKSSVSRISDILGSSSPIDLIETPLHDFLRNILSSDNFLTSRSVIALVGGAGNGKTESLGFILEEISKNFQLFLDRTKIKEQLEESLFSNKGYFASFIDHGFRLSFIQDATSVWSENEIFYSKSESIQKSFDKAFNNDENGLLVICINRGVLSDLLREIEPSVLRSVFAEINVQSNFDSYISNISNIRSSHELGFSISSYPLDKMRLFQGEGVHSRFVDQMNQAEWNDNYSKLVFFESQKSIGSLLDCLELTKGGLLTFRDYLNFLSLFYSNEFEQQWMNIPTIKLWFANQIGPVKDSFDRVLMKSSYHDFWKNVEDLLKWRNSYDELLSFEYLDPLKVSELIDSDDVQRLLDNLRESADYAVSRVVVNGVNYKLSHVYIKIFAILGEIDEWLDEVKSDNSADTYTVKRYIFNLCAQLLSFILFEQNGVFFRSKEMSSFTNLDSSVMISEIGDALGLKVSDDKGCFNKITLSLVDEIWVNKQQLTVSKDFPLNLRIREIESSTKFKPKLPYRIFEFSDMNSQNSFVIKVSFEQYCQISEFKGNLEIYYESLSVSFAIWINNIREKLRMFSLRDDCVIDVLGNSININSPR